MIFFKRILILNNKETNKNCGYLTLTKRNNLISANIKAFGLDENETFDINIFSNEKKCFSAAHSGNEIKNLNFNLDDRTDISSPIKAQISKHQTENRLTSDKTISDANESILKSQNTEEPETLVLEEEKTKKNCFFDSVKEKVEKMFLENQPFEKLSSYIENSKWVKVDVDENGLYYLLGLIYENGNVKQICYALPAKKNDAPPAHLKEFCTFVECENDDGFFVMSQDAENGENLII